MANLNLNATGTSTKDTTNQQTTFTPSAARKVAGSLIGGALNFVAPGIGSLVGNAIGGSSVPSNGLTSSLVDDMAKQNMDMLIFQYQVNMESRMYDSASNTIKARHDSNMNSIRNFKS